MWLPMSGGLDLPLQHTSKLHCIYVNKSFLNGTVCCENTLLGTSEDCQEAGDSKSVGERGSYHFLFYFIHLPEREMKRINTIRH